MIKFDFSGWLEMARIDKDGLKDSSNKWDWPKPRNCLRGLAKWASITKTDGRSHDAPVAEDADLPCKPSSFYHGMGPVGVRLLPRNLHTNLPFLERCKKPLPIITFF
jgi:hypothetical protein